MINGSMIDKKESMSLYLPTWEKRSRTKRINSWNNLNNGSIRWSKMRLASISAIGNRCCLNYRHTWFVHVDIKCHWRRNCNKWNRNKASFMHLWCCNDHHHRLCRERRRTMTIVVEAVVTFIEWGGCVCVIINTVAIRQPYSISMISIWKYNRHVHTRLMIGKNCNGIANPSSTSGGWK